jgi:DNA-binding NarL/FixJ family response regulator
VRIVIAEDEALLREGLVRLLSDEGWDVVATAADEQELLVRARSRDPDLVIADIRMPPTHTDEGMKAARQLRGERPGLPVLLLSQYVDAEGAMDLVADGADGVGYLLKQRVMEVERFVEACRLVASGGSIIDPEIVASMMGRRRVDDPVDRLTPRQLEVLGLMAEGRSNAAIAGQLFITEKAVARHINAIFHTLGLPPARDDHRRVLAVLSYLNR